MSPPDPLLTQHARSSAWEPLAQQQVFRRLVKAFAYPGRCQMVLVDPARAAIDSALMRVLATLLDGEVGLADPDGLIAADDRPRLEAREIAAEHAHFVLARGDRAPEFQPSLGTLENPERGATVILRVGELGAGARLTLQGPGIAGHAELAVTGLEPAWLAARADWNDAFPMGVDLLLVDDTRVAALPRTTRIQTPGER